MPRLPPRLFHRAASFSRDAARLLPTCRDIPSSLRELRWIKEHVASLSPPSTHKTSEESRAELSANELYRQWQVTHLCRLRGSGVPLQYVLGTQPFGHLEIQCRSGVLIPRPEPEAYTTHLAHLLNTGKIPSLQPPSFTTADSTPLRILDLCTGTGCIALLMHSLLSPRFPSLVTRGVDISPRAISLARENARYNDLPAPERSAHLQGTIDFRMADMFGGYFDGGLGDEDWDVITCNPPYISTSGFAHDTARAVRNFEPKLAQVPGKHLLSDPSVALEDVFYARLIELVAAMARPPRVLLCEVGGIEQAKRVAAMFVRRSKWGLGLDRRIKRSRELDGDQNKIQHKRPVEVLDVETWRDSPDIPYRNGKDKTLQRIEGKQISDRGKGHGRSVFVRYR